MYSPLRCDAGEEQGGVEIPLTEFPNKSEPAARDERNGHLTEVENAASSEDVEMSNGDVVLSVETELQLAAGKGSERAQAVNSLKGLTLMLVAAVFFSLMALLVNAISATGVPTFELVFFRSLIGLVLSSSYLYATKSTLIGEPRHRPLLMLRGVLGTVSQACYYFALSKLFLADAVVLSFLAPVFTTLIAHLVLGEALVVLDFIGATLSIGGVIMIARPPFLFGASSSSADEISGLMRWIAIASALVSSMFSALAYVTVRKLGTAVSAMLLVNYFSITGVLIALPLTVTIETPVLPHGLHLLLLIGVGLSAWFGQICLNRGLQLERAGAAASVNYVGVVFAFSFQVLILHQPVNFWTTTGAALICTYAALLFAKKFMALQATKK